VATLTQKRGKTGCEAWHLCREGVASLRGSGDFASQFKRLQDAPVDSSCSTYKSFFAKDIGRQWRLNPKLSVGRESREMMQRGTDLMMVFRR
jgi:hypothetical protein